VASGGSVFKAVRGEYGCERLLAAGGGRSRKQAFATPRSRSPETERRCIGWSGLSPAEERLATADTPQVRCGTSSTAGCLRLEDVPGRRDCPGDDQQQLLERTTELLEKRVTKITSTAPTFAPALRGYRQAQAQAMPATAEGLWLAGRPAQCGAAAKRFAGVKGDWTTSAP